jgi:hypothetical protein
VMAPAAGVGNEACAVGVDLLHAHARAAARSVTTSARGPNGRTSGTLPTPGDTYNGVTYNAACSVKGVKQSRPVGTWGDPPGPAVRRSCA